MPFIISGPNPDPAELTATPITVDPPDLLGDLPPFEQASPDIQGVLRALGNELARLEAARRELIANFFPGSADALLRFYEAMLGLPVNSPTMTLPDRQAAVLAFMQGLKSSGSGLEWVATITALIGTGWSFELYNSGLTDAPPPYTILIRTPFSGPAPIPAGLAAVQSGAGTLATGNYWYAVSSLTAYGETVPCAPVGMSIAGGPAGIAVTWNAQLAPVNGYKVYRGPTSTSLQLVDTVAGAGTGTITFNDNGSETPGAAPLTMDSSSSMQAAVVQKLARSITPAHLDLIVGYTTGFLVGISDIGIDAL